MPKKLTYGFVKKSFEKEGYELLSKEYINSYTKLEYICPRGHKYNISWGNWSQGRRCPYCSKYRNRYTIEFIRSEFAKENYTLLSKEYKNAHQKLEYICPNGHRHSISWSNWNSKLKKHRCSICSRKKVANSQRLDMDYIRKSFEKEEYKLLTTEYINSQQKLECICPNNHNYSVTWANWQQGHRCPCQSYCMRPTIEFIRSEFAKEDYKLLTTEYVNNQQKLDYICPEGHEHSINWKHWWDGTRCPECIGIISKGETQVRNFVKSLNIEVSSNNRNQIFNPETNYGLELDIFMPSLNKAIEYNGEYWHQDKDRDLLKQQLCKSKSIDLLTIWDKEWLNDKKKCKSKIVNFIEN